ncbi:MAG: ROK family protein, partial [Candidatus Nanopelagicales bacterium]|nr:ROK family protein [Candidatus Nanopelagicales bacterium]
MSLTVGVDIGGTKIAAGVVDDKGAILAKQRVATAGRDAEKVEESVAELVAALSAKYDIEAVGIGAAGFVDEKRSRV